MSGMAELLHDALAYVASLGPAGYAAFIALYAGACVAFLPLSPLSFGAGAFFGVETGFVLVCIGATIGMCLSFLIGRHWLRAWVEKRLARYPLFAAIDAAVSVQGWRVVFLTRLTPVFPFAFLNYAYGLTRVTFREYALASFIGILPGALMFVYLGAAAGEALQAGMMGRARTPIEWVFFGVGLLAALAVVTLIGRAAGRELRKKAPPL